MESGISPHEHCTDEILTDYVDRVLDRTAMKQVDRHVRLCQVCEHKVRMLRRIGTAVRIAGAEKTSPEFTRIVLDTLRVPDAPSYAWKFFQSLAPIIGLTLVLGVTFGILWLTGVLDGTAAADSMSITTSFLSSVFRHTSEAGRSLNTWLQTYLSFAFARSSYGLTIFIVVFFGLLALIDKYLLDPYMRRRG